MVFRVEDLSCGYRKVPVVTDISFQVKSGESLCILGPNGVGKTTLFRSILGLIPLISGKISINDDEILAWNARKKASYIGYIPQAHTPPFPYTVMEVAVMGRTSKRGMFASPGKEDYEFTEEVLNQLGIYHLKDRIYTQISGGERQMTLVARALTQEPHILMMDEPTANLDFSNQANVLENICTLTDSGKIVIFTTHTPDHALLCGSNVFLMERGNVQRFGSADEMISRSALSEAYGIDVCITSARQDGNEVRGCVPILHSHKNKSAL